jgi:acetylornithine/N-succinyldiaminopimelate aminotransferase
VESELLKQASTFLYPNYRQAPFVLTRGKGCEVFDTENRRYLDMTAGVAVSVLGHAHPKFVAAIAEQVARLVHVSNYFYNEPNVLLATELCKRTGFDRVLFCNSGTEANEAMLKLARHHFFLKGETEKMRIVAFERSFHGRTMGSLAMTGEPKYREGFGPSVGGVTHVPYGDRPALRAAMGKDVAAVIVETVQGEGGVVPAPEGFLQEIRTLTEDLGALMLVDEVQTGIGRTGKMLGFQHSQLRPDAISLAKGLGGGFPIGAMLCTKELENALPPGTHGTTCGGNPLASRAALTVLRVLEEEGLIDAAQKQGDYLAIRLQGLVERYPDLFECARGVGLLQAAVMKPGNDGRAMLARIREQGVLVTIAGGTALRFTPPLIVTKAQIDEAVDGVERAITNG